MTPETKQKNKVKARMTAEFGAWLWGFAPAASKFGKRGVPDLIYCVAGLFVAIEVKAPGAKSRVTELQARQLQKIAEAGGLSFVVYDEQSLDLAVNVTRQRVEYKPEEQSSEGE